MHHEGGYEALSYPFLCKMLVKHSPTSFSHFDNILGCGPRIAACNFPVKLASPNGNSDDKTVRKIWSVVICQNPKFLDMIVEHVKSEEQ